MATSGSVGSASPITPSIPASAAGPDAPTPMSEFPTVEETLLRQIEAKRDTANHLTGDEIEWLILQAKECGQLERELATATARAVAAENDFVQVHKNCIQAREMYEAERKAREEAEFKAKVTHENNLFLKEGMRNEHERAEEAERDRDALAVLCSSSPSAAVRRAEAAEARLLIATEGLRHIVSESINAEGIAEAALDAIAAAPKA